MDNSLIINILEFIYKFMNTVFPFYYWGLIIYIFSSFIPQLNESQFRQTLGMLYEPLLKPLRNIIPPLGGVLDLSPIILFFGLKLFLNGFNQLIIWLITLLIN